MLGIFSYSLKLFLEISDNVFITFSIPYKNVLSSIYNIYLGVYSLLLITAIKAIRHTRSLSELTTNSTRGTHTHTHTHKHTHTYTHTTHTYTHTNTHTHTHTHNCNITQFSRR